MKKQQGATLLVVLIMLVLMTLAAAMSFNAGRTNTAIIGNQQAVQGTTDAARVALDEVLSRPLFVQSPATPFGGTNQRQYDINSDGNMDVTVRITQTCIKNFTILPKIEDPTAEDSKGCVSSEEQNKGIEGAETASTCADVTWELVAEAQDMVTEAKTIAVQGVRVRQHVSATSNTANFCP